LIALGLVTALRSTPRPRILLLDDLDRALRPRAQRDLVAVLQRALDQPENADLQIIATTHSPFIVDAVPADDVRVLSLGPEGHARCKKLTDHPDWQKWREQLKAEARAVPA
jgi:predicted ATP-binding protein involved in virulence